MVAEACITNKCLFAVVLSANAPSVAVVQNLVCADPSVMQMHDDDIGCYKVWDCAGPGRVAMAEGKQIIGAESECSVGLYSDSFIEPCNEVAYTRQQLLTAISLLKHLAHNSPAAGEALTYVGVMDTIRRYADTSARLNDATT